MEAHAENTTPAAEKRSIDPILVGLPAGFVLCIFLLPLQLDRLFGLPAHPLLLHAPVVLIPILAAATVALMVRPDWRERHGVVLAVLALASLAATVLAAGAGDALREARFAAFAGIPGGDAALNEHAELGEGLRNIMFAFTGGLIGIVILDTVSRRGEGPARLVQLAGLLRHPTIDKIVRVGTVLVAALALVWVIRAGHTGAKLAWDEAYAGARAQQPPALSGDSQGSGRLP